MSGTDRESPHGELVVRHSHSYSESGRSPIPMWDSSDPERNPPPLPLNPSSPVTTRANTSSTVAAAAAALAEKTRESISSYVTNPPPPRSPEKTLIRSAQHKRMQTFQPGAVRDFSKYIEAKTPEHSPERFPRTPYLTDYENRSPEKTPTRRTPTPPQKDYFDRDRDITSIPAMPSLRPTSRHLNKPILGENTPPSATVRALQNMTVPSSLVDPPLQNISANTNSPAARTPHTFDAISSQILSLTQICTNLQREMANLSRRSKDNATDLLSLKEATNARDEDIRRSLRELVQNMANKFDSQSDKGSTLSFISEPVKPHLSPGGSKSFSAPRVSSPNSFASSLERELAGTPNPFSMDGAAALALLEKILREMGTKEGQERVLKTINETLGMPLTIESQKETLKQIEDKLEGIQKIVKESVDSKALIRVNNGGPVKEFSNSLDDVGASKNLAQMSRASDFVTDDVWKVLKKMKDSVAESGGLTSEVKALVRELRGEVLGMGREIARKLEQVDLQQRKNPYGDPRGPGRDDIVQIVENSLAELKEHMDRVIRERRRQSSSSTMSRSTVDSQEVYNAVKSALAEVQLPQAGADSGVSVERDEIIEAVREAWETYKPEIEVQHFGLERDELLQCLKEGLEEYKPKHQTTAASYEEVLDAVKAGLKHFTPPPVETEATITREEILSAVRECLEAFEFPTQSPKEPDLTRDDVIDAVKEGLSIQGHLAKEIEFNREDLVEAVKVGINGSSTPLAGVAERVLQAMNDLISSMRSEFKQSSAANGRDTEQILDALKDGLEVLRSEIESYVDRASDVTGRDEIIDTLKGSLDSLKYDLEATIKSSEARAPDNTGDILEALEKEFDHLRQTIATTMIHDGGSSDKDEIVDTFRDGLNGLKVEIQNAMVPRDPAPGHVAEIIGALEREFDQLRQSMGKDSSDKMEIIDTFKSCLQSLRADVESSIVNSTRDLGAGTTTEILDALEKEFDHLRQTITHSLRSDSGTNDKDEILDAIKEALEVQDRKVMKVSQEETDLASTMKEEFEYLRGTLAKTILHASSSSDKDEILEALESGINSIKLDLAPTNKDGNLASSTTELLNAFSDGVADLKADIDKLANKSLDMTVNYDILETLKEGLASLKRDIDKLREEKSTSNDMAITRAIDNPPPEDKLRKADIANLEVLIAQLRAKVESLGDLADKVPHTSPTESSVGKDDLASVEAAVKRAVKEEDLASVEARLKENLAILESNIQTVHNMVAQIANREPKGPATVVDKEDTEAIETLLRNTKARIDEMTFPDAEGLARAEHVASVEVSVKEAKTAVDELAARMAADGASKDDIGVLEGLIRNAQANIEDIRDQMKEDEDKNIAKIDIEAIGTICTEIKTTIDDISIPDPETLPTKEQIADLESLLRDFKEDVERGHELVAQAFEARKIEHGGLAAKIDDVKTFIETIKTDLKGSIQNESKGLDAANKSIENLERALKSHATSDNVGGLVELVKKEFERVHGESEARKADMNEKHMGIMKKHDENRGAIVIDVQKKIDERFDELMTKYDDAQLANDEKIKILESSGTKALEASDSINTIAADLKAACDTLGTTMTDTFEKMSEESKTIFDRVDVTATRVEEMQADDKDQHRLTREEVAKVLTAVGSLEGQVTGNHPKILESIRGVLNLLNEKFENAEKTAEEFRTSTQALKTSVDQIPASIPRPEPPAPLALPPIPEKYDDSTVLEKLNVLVERAPYDDSPVKGKLEELLNRPLYDDSTVQGKLDELVNRPAYDDSDIKGVLGSLYERPIYDDSEMRKKLDKLLSRPSSDDEIKQKLGELIKHNDSEVKTKLEFLVKRPVYDDTPIKTKLDRLIGRPVYDDSAVQEKLHALLDQAAATGAAVARMTLLEQIQEQVAGFVTFQKAVLAKDQESKAKEAQEAAIALEKSITERQHVQTEVHDLTEERNTLFSTVQSLRRDKDELVSQKATLRADISALETALKIRKEEIILVEKRAEELERRILEGVLDHSRSLLVTRTQGPKGMNLKRVPSNASAATRGSPMVGKDHGSALSSGVGMALRGKAATKGVAERRILSLSQLSANKGATPNQAGFASPADTNFGNLKRSHSVKTSITHRKASWSGKTSTANKENDVNKIAEEEEVSETDSETATERRTSYSMSVDDDSEMSESEGSESEEEELPSVTTSVAGTTGQGSMSGEGQGEAVEEDGSECDSEEIDDDDDETIEGMLNDNRQDEKLGQQATAPTGRSGREMEAPPTADLAASQAMGGEYEYFDNGH